MNTARWLVGVLVGHVPVLSPYKCDGCGAVHEWLTYSQAGLVAASGKAPHCRDGALIAVSGEQAVTR